MNISDKGIWLYFSEKGSLISKIQHGEVVRQDGSFKLIFAFENPEKLKGKALRVGFKVPGSTKVEDFITVGGYNDLDTAKFKKIKSSEMTYGLIDNKEYKVLHQDFSNTYTGKYGMLQVNSKIVDLENEDTISFQGSVQLYIEPTFGKVEDTTNIPKTQWENYKASIENILDKKMNRYSDTGVDTSFIGEIDTTKEYVLDENGNKIIPDENTPVNVTKNKTHLSVNEPQKPEHAANKKYVDKTVSTSPTINNATLLGVTNATESIVNLKEIDKENSTKFQAVNKGYVDANFLPKDGGVAENLKINKKLDVSGEGAEIEVNEPTKGTHPVNKKYAEENFVKAVDGEANRLTLKGTVKAASEGTYLEINEPVSSNNPLTKNYFDTKVGNMNELEAGKGKNIVEAINNATTKNEVNEMLEPYAIADNVEDFEEEVAVLVYKADIAVSDETGANIAEQFADLTEIINTLPTGNDVSVSIVNHNVDILAHNDIRTDINGLATRVGTVEGKVNDLLAGITDTELDTLKELADAITDNADLMTTLNTAIGLKASKEELKAVENKIPTVNNGTLTIQRNGVTLKTFTADSSSNVTVDISVPTDNNQIGNSAGYITSSGNITGNAATATLATKATNDGAGNNISQTYATKEEIKNFVSVQVVNGVLVIG